MATRPPLQSTGRLGQRRGLYNPWTRLIEVGPSTVLALRAWFRMSQHVYRFETAIYFCCCLLQRLRWSPRWVATAATSRATTPSATSSTPVRTRRTMSRAGASSSPLTTTRQYCRSVDQWFRVDDLCCTAINCCHAGYERATDESTTKAASAIAERRPTSLNNARFCRREP